MINIAMLLEMAADAMGSRVIVGTAEHGLSATNLRERALAAAAWIAEHDVERLVLVDVNSEAVPIGFFGAALAGVPFVPVSYRVDDERLNALVARTRPSITVVGDAIADRLRGLDGVDLVSRREFLAVSAGHQPVSAPLEHDIAALLFTSGTTGEPKSAVLRHAHLASYVLGTVEFMSASDGDAALVSVPPYHIAGLMAILTSVYSGRRLVYLPSFDPESWVVTARDQQITNAMVVPTMLGRILDVIEARGEELPALRAISYGGGRMPVPVVQRAMELLPQVAFTNAYGLTETSSTIAVLTPEDHRKALDSDDPAVHRRLGSVGRPLPSLELEVRGPMGEVVPPGEVGEIWVRGEQVSGEYLERGSTKHDGWFPTSDAGWLDDAGYLFVEGRLDDVIVRGAENLSPGEIEEVLLDHPAVAEAAVVGVPDVEWGETVAAAVVLEQHRTASEQDLQAWVRNRLRSSRTPSIVEFRDALPYNETGKLLRRVLREDLSKRCDVVHGEAVRVPTEQNR